MSPRLLLYPFSLLFCMAVKIRNFMFDKGILKSVSYPLPLISVGNLTVGGTGKTPLTEYLIKLLSQKYRCALLSRGYGRKSKGPLIASGKETALTIGDEPMQIKLKFPDIDVAVAEKRVLGMSQLLELPTPPDVVLLDDAFQHRAVKPGLSILVTDYHRPVYSDVCLPAGNLREPFEGIYRAQVIIINKCPQNFSPQQKDVILKKLNPQSHQQVFFSTINYQPPRKFMTDSGDLSFSKLTSLKEVPILAMAGIGNPSPFFAETKKYSSKVKTIAFSDHHDFTLTDINKISRITKETGPDTIVLTTEKDAIRLKEQDINTELAAKIWYIPIELKILFNRQDIFNKTIEHYVSTNQRNS